MRRGGAREPQSREERGSKCADQSQCFRHADAWILAGAPQPRLNEATVSICAVFPAPERLNSAVFERPSAGNVASAMPVSARAPAAPLPRSTRDRPAAAWATSTAPPTRCSAATSRSRCWPSATRQTTGSASGSRARRWRPRGSRASPSIVTIFDVGEWRRAGRSSSWSTSSGGSLEDRLRSEGAQPPARVARPGSNRPRRRSTPRTARGVVHRDVKPAQPAARRATATSASPTSASRARPGCDSLTLDRDGARYGGLPLAGAGAGRARDAGERPLRARRRRVRAADRRAAVRARERRPPRRPRTCNAPVPSIAERRATFRRSSTPSSGARSRRIPSGDTRSARGVRRRSARRARRERRRTRVDRASSPQRRAARRSPARSFRSRSLARGRRWRERSWRRSWRRGGVAARRRRRAQ